MDQVHGIVRALLFLKNDCLNIWLNFHGDHLWWGHACTLSSTKRSNQACVFVCNGSRNSWQNILLRTRVQRVVVHGGTLVMTTIAVNDRQPPVRCIDILTALHTQTNDNILLVAFLCVPVQDGLGHPSVLLDHRQVVHRPASVRSHGIQKTWILCPIIQPNNSIVSMLCSTWNLCSRLVTVLPGARSSHDHFVDMSRCVRWQFVGWWLFPAESCPHWPAIKYSNRQGIPELSGSTVVVHHRHWLTPFATFCRLPVPFDCLIENQF